MTPRAAGTSGRLIVLEGVEGAGKTTQAARLTAGLAEGGGAPSVVLVREPGATWIGERIRGLLLQADVEMDARAEAFLFLAARAQLMVDIRHHLAAGAIVIADRFFLSTYAYQIEGRGLPEAQVVAANQLAVGGLVPDLTLILQLSAKAGLARKDMAGGRRDRIEGASIDFHERVTTAFRRFATPAWQQAHPECGPIEVVDAQGSEDVVAARVAAIVSGRWPTVPSRGPRKSAGH